MNILYLSDILNIHDIRFLRKYAQSPHRVILYTFYHRSPELPDGIRNIPRLEIVHRDLPGYPDGARCPSERIPRFLIYGRSFLQALSLLKRDVRRFHIDLVVSGWLLTSSFLAAVSGVHPILMTPWGSDVLLYPKWRRRYREMARYTLSKADFVSCDARHVMRQAIELGRIATEKTLVVPWGVDLKLFHPHRSDPDLRNRLGWQGKTIAITTRSLEPVYRIEWALRALARLSSRHPDLCLIIVGRGSCDTDLQRATRELGLDNRVHFAGFVPNERLAYFLNAADLYVSPSQSDGTSLSLLEAMACGLPVVVSDLPAIREWVVHGENGLLFDPARQEELESALDRLLTDPLLRSSSREKNVRIIQDRADWDRGFDSLLRAAEDLVSRYRVSS